MKSPLPSPNKSVMKKIKSSICIISGVNETNSSQRVTHLPDVEVFNNRFIQVTNSITKMKLKDILSLVVISINQ